jgi:hypothetical protein
MIGTLLYASHACSTGWQKQAKALIGHIAIISRAEHVLMLLFDTEKLSSDDYLRTRRVAARPLTMSAERAYAGRIDVLDQIFVYVQDHINRAADFL